jgi:hypothetical protein
MTEHDLGTDLRRAAGTPDDRPALDGLWATGRARRRRGRVLAGAAALVVVAAVVAGALALSSGGGDDPDEVVAGPTTTTLAPPPAEPADGPVTMALAAGAVVDGVPGLDPGQAVEATYDGTPAGFSRGRRASWERWDGARWVEELFLIRGDATTPGAVVPTEPLPTVPADATTGPGPDVFPTPDDLDPGWYRICMPMTGTAGEIRPCGQLRVADPDAAPGPVVVDPPPAEPTYLHTLTAEIEGPVTPGATIDLEIGTPGGAVLGAFTTWDQWDGFRWVPTHLVEGYLTTSERPTLVTLAPGEEVVVPSIGYGSTGDVTPARALVPPVGDLRSPWSRVCVDTGIADDLRPCVQLAVEGAPSGVDPAFVGEPDPETGEPAGWVVDPASPPDAASTSVAVLATPIGCGHELLDPIVTLEADRVMIRIDAVPIGDAAACRSETVPVTVDLGEPLGDRTLVDGLCHRAEAVLWGECTQGDRRWPLPG